METQDFESADLEMLDDGEPQFEQNATGQPVAVKHIEKMAATVLSQLGTIMGSFDVEAASDNEAIDETISVKLASRRKKSESQDTGFRQVRWPRQKGSTKPLASLLRVAELSHEALLNNTVTTKREIFYHDVPLFARQSTVDTLVDDLAATFALQRADLNITASSKGLICGATLTFHFAAGGSTTLHSTEATLIPSGEDLASIEIDDNIGYVLIVEKEAVFKTLCSTAFSASKLLPRPGIIVTGKGYPDIATRQLVHRLGNLLPDSVPFAVLVDADAYGLEILSVYKYGSASLKHENEGLICPRAEWIGVLGSELDVLGVHKNALLSMTELDRRKTLDLLSRPDALMPSLWRNELSSALHTHTKAEIEILSSAKFDCICPPLFIASDPTRMQSWSLLINGPVIVPYLLAKLGALIQS